MRVRHTRLILIAAGLLSAQAALFAQWLRYPTAGVPRTRDRKPNLTAPTPRTRDGRPDLSGVWLTGTGLPCSNQPGQDFLECGVELPLSREGVDMGASLPGGLPRVPLRGCTWIVRAGRSSRWRFLLGVAGLVSTAAARIVKQCEAFHQTKKRRNSKAQKLFHDLGRLHGRHVPHRRGLHRRGNGPVHRGKHRRQADGAQLVRAPTIPQHQ